MVTVLFPGLRLPDSLSMGSEKWLARDGHMTRTAVALTFLLWAALTAAWIVSENASPITSTKNRRDQVLNQQAPKIRVGYIGDSLLQGNNLAARDGLLITAQANREITWTRALYPHFDIDTWIDLADSFRHFSGMNAGLSGDTAAQVRARMNAPGSPLPDIMIVSVGINSVTFGVSARSIQSDLQAICQFYLQRGIKVILSNIRPISAEFVPDGDPQLSVRSDVNAWIREFATTTADVVFWDVAAAYDDGSGRPLAGYTVDGLHPSSFGSQHAALSLVPIIRQLVKPGQPPSPGPINFFPNGQLAGKHGTAGPGVKGQIADGFTAEMLSPGATVTVEAAARPNRETGGGVQEFSFTLRGGSSIEVFGLTGKRFDVSMLAGKWVKARCKLTLQPWDGWRALYFNTTYMEWESNAPKTDELMQGIVWDLELETMPFKLPDHPSRIAPALRLYLHADRATGSGVMQVKEFEFFEVASPLPARNADRVEQN
jgi:lysophospholipase L1-like esterase